TARRYRSGGLRLAGAVQLEHELPGVATCEQPREHARERLDAALYGVLDASEPALLQPARQLRNRLAITLGEVEYDEARHRRPRHQQHHVVARALHASRAVVLGDRAADDDSGSTCQACQALVENLAADVVEEDVDLVGSVASKLVAEVVRLVIDCGVKPKLVDEHSALLGSAGHAHDSTALDLRDLSGGGADRA